MTGDVLSEQNAPSASSGDQEKAPARFDAFISYSHAADGRLAPAVQRALHRIARPWFRTRALHVFRDKTSLAVTPALWPSIEAALNRSRYLIVLASPEAAASEWVGREVRWWLTHRSVNTLMIVATDGEIRWDTPRCDFDWAITTALPICLRGQFAQEPLWVDLRFARDQDRLSLRHGAFRDAMVTLAAPLHNKGKDQIEGADVRHHRRTMRLAGSALAVVVTLTFATTAFAVLERIQRQRADAEELVATARATAARAAALRRIDPALARQLTVAAHEMANQDPEVTNAVLAAGSIPKVATIGHRPVHPSVLFVRGGAALAVGADRDTDNDADTGDGGVDFLDPNTLARISTADSIPDGSHRILLGEVTDMAVGANQNLLAVAGQTGMSLWDISDLRVPQPLSIREVSLTADPRWARIAFSPVSPIVAFGRESTVQVYDVANPRSPQLLGEVPGEGELAEFGFSPDGRTLAVHDNELGTVTLWDVATLWDVTAPRPPTKLAVLPDAENNQLNSRPPPALAFGPGGILGYAGVRNTIRLYRVTNPSKPELLETIEGHLEPVISLDFSPDGRLLASGSSDATVHITDLSSPDGVTPLGIIDEHAEDVTDISFGPDGTTLATVSQDVTVRVWPFTDPRRRLALSSITGPAATGVLSATPDRTLTITGGGGDENITLWDTHDATRPTLLSTTDVDGNVADATISRDGKTLVVARSEFEDPIRLLNIANPREPRPVVTLSGYPSFPTKVALSGDDKLLAIGTMVGQIHIYDVGNPATPRYVTMIDRAGPTESDRIGWVTGLAFAPTRPLLVGTSLIYSTTVWDLTNSDNPVPVTQVKKHTEEVTGTVFSSDGQWLATTDRVGTVLLWNMTDMAAIRSDFAPVAILGTASSEIPVVDFSPDGRRLVIAVSQDIHVWDLDRPGGPVQTVALNRIGTEPRNVLFGPNARTVLVAVQDPAIDVIGLDATDMARRLCEGAGQRITEPQWRQYLPNRPYHPPCP